MTHDDRLEARDPILLRGQVIVISGAAHGIGR